MECVSISGALTGLSDSDDAVEHGVVSRMKNVGETARCDDSDGFILG